MTKIIHVLNGPNLNMLGQREPEIYGTQTLKDAQSLVEARASALGYEVTFRQTNHEGVLIDWIQEARGTGVAIVLNAGALTHTSIGIYDALLTFEGPIVELHVSNPMAREDFRHTSHVARAATGTITGLGIFGYSLAIDAVHSLLQ